MKDQKPEEHTTLFIHVCFVMTFIQTSKLTLRIKMPTKKRYNKLKPWNRKKSSATQKRKLTLWRKSIEKLRWFAIRETISTICLFFKKVRAKYYFQEEPRINSVWNNIGFARNVLNGFSLRNQLQIIGPLVQRLRQDQITMDHPSTALKIGFDLCRLASVKLGNSIKSGEEQGRLDASNFLNLMKLE